MGAGFARRIGPEEAVKRRGEVARVEEDYCREQKVETLCTESLVLELPVTKFAQPIKE